MTDREPGAVVAWRNLIGEGRWFYSEIDPRNVHDNGKQTDALVLATDYEAISQALQESEAARFRLDQQNEAMRARAEAAEARLGLYRKAINEIDDRAEYRLIDQTAIYEILGRLTAALAEQERGG